MKYALIGASALALLAPAALAQPTPTPAQAQAQQTDPGTYYVFFDFDRSNLRSDASRVITEAADEYRREGRARVQIIGAADKSGSSDYNQRLSARRADTVRQALVQQGVPASAISVAAEGENLPIVPTADGVREARNRYVAITFPIEQPAPVAQAAPAAPAPEPQRIRRFEFMVGGLYGYNFREQDGDNDTESQIVGPELTLAYRVTPNLTLRVNQAAVYAFDAENEGWGGRTVAGLDLNGNFRGAKPYIGINAGGVYGNGWQDGFVVGPELGIKVDVSEKTFLYAKAAYDYQFRNPNWDDGIAYGGLGVGFRF